MSSPPKREGLPFEVGSLWNSHSRGTNRARERGLKRLEGYLFGFTRVEREGEYRLMDMGVPSSLGSSSYLNRNVGIMQHLGRRELSNLYHTSVEYGDLYKTRVGVGTFLARVLRSPRW